MRFTCACGEHLRCNDDRTTQPMTCPRCGREVSPEPDGSAEGTVVDTSRGVAAPSRQPTALDAPAPPLPGFASHATAGWSSWAPAPVAIPPPPTIPGYEILGVLGRGGMGVVYKARQHGLDRLVALKMILAGGHTDAATRTRFRTEAQAAARLQHPNIAQVFEIGEHEGRPFFSLEFCAGGSLDRKLGGTPLAPEEAARLLEILARAVHAAHQHQILHRDLKPTNVLLDAAGTPKISDFGLAKKLDDVGQTQSGSVLGTPSYMAPEQARGQVQDLGPATDVYGLGTILYELLTGRPPFRAATALETLLQVTTHDPVPPRRLQPTTPRDLETICQTAMAKEPARRYASALDLADDLKRFLAHEPIHARSATWTERLGLWARRNPVVAGLTVTAVALTIAVVAVATAGYLQTAAAFAAVDQERGEVVRQRDQANQNLYHSLVGQAQGLRLARVEGFRSRIGRLLRDAGRLETPAVNREELRNEAVAAMGDSMGFAPIVFDALEATPTALTVHPHLRSVAIGLANGAILIRDAPAGQAPAVLRGHRSAISTLAFHRDGTQLYSVDAGNVCKLWEPDPATGWRCSATRTMPARILTTVLHSSDDRLPFIASGMAGAYVQMADLAGQAAPVPLRYDGWILNCVTVSADGRWAAAGGSRGGEFGILLWDTSNPQPRTHSLASLGIVLRVEFSPDGKLLACGCNEGLAVLDVPTLAERSRQRLDTVLSVAFSADNQFLAFGTISSRVKVLSVSTNRELMTLKCAARGSTEVRDVAFGADGATLAARIAGSVRVWDLAAAEEKRVLGGHAGGVPCVAFHPEGKVLASGSKDQKVKFWNPATGRLLHTSAPLGTFIQGLAYSRDGRMLAVVGNSYLQICDGVTFKTLLAEPLPLGLGELAGVAFSPDGTYLAVCGESGFALARVRQTAATVTLEKVATLPGARCLYLAYSPDGRTVAWVDRNVLVRLFDVQERKEIAFKGPRLLLGWHNLAFHPDGRHLLFVGSTGAAETWDIFTGQREYTLGKPGEFENFHVALSPDGRLFAADATAAAASIWDLESKQRLFLLPEERSPIWSLAWSPDGELLALGLSDGGLVVWSLPKIRAELVRLGINES